MKVSAWKTALIDIDRDTEFAGDDVDRYSKLVDLLENYEFLTVRLPALSASAIISCYVQEGEAESEVPLIVHVLDNDATGSFAHSTSSGAGSISVTFRIGGHQFVRIHASENQSADRSIKIRGFNREPLY